MAWSNSSLGGMCFYILIIVIDYCIVDNGVDGKWGTENHPFQCFASAQGNVCLSVGESGAGVNNGVFKSQSLAFMNSDRPMPVLQGIA